MANEYDLQPALDAAQNQLSLTFSTSDSLDSKALAVLGFDVAIGIFGLQSRMSQALWIHILIFSILIISLLLALYSALPRKYIGAVINLDEHPEYFEFAAEDLVLQLLADSQEAIVRNTNLNIIKTRYCMAAIITGLIAAMGVVVCII